MINIFDIHARTHAFNHLYNHTWRKRKQKNKMKRIMFYCCCFLCVYAEMQQKKYQNTQNCHGHKIRIRMVNQSKTRNNRTSDTNFIQYVPFFAIFNKTLRIKQHRTRILFCIFFLFSLIHSLINIHPTNGTCKCSFEFSFLQIIFKYTHIVNHISNNKFHWHARREKRCENQIRNEWW